MRPNSRFKEVAAAYAVLGDDAKRARYDRYGQDADGAVEYDSDSEGEAFDPYELFAQMFAGSMPGSFFGAGSSSPGRV
jgi:DnaJ-class molecular chaperone